MCGVLGSAVFWACGPAFPDQVNGKFDFTKDAFLFNNFDDSVGGATVDATLAARMFGDQAVCLTGAGATCRPRAAAQVWLDDVNAQMTFGHSEGMAVLSLLMSLGKVNPNDFGGANAAALSLDKGALRAELAYWAATQKLQAAHAKDKKLGARDALAFLATALPDANEGWRLLLSQRDATGFHAGHAVVPFGYFRGTEKGQYFIRIYDPNFPAEERRIEVNAETNSWKYEGSPDPTKPRSYEGTADNGNLLYFSPVTARMGTFTAPFTDGFSASASGTLYVEGDGAKVGFQNGELIENGGLALPGAADCFCKAPTGITNVMVAGNGAKTVSVGADAGTVYAMSSTVAAKVEPQGAASVTVDPAAKTVTYNSTSDAGTTIITTTKNADGSETTVTVTLDKAATGVTVDASDPKNVKVTCDVTTSTTNVHVTTAVTKPDGSTTTTNAAGTTMGGKDVAFTVDAVAGTATVNNNVNYAVCLNGKKDPMETDVDCGEFCHGQVEHDGDGRCVLNKKCSKAADCSYTAANGVGAAIDAPGDCLNGTCVAVSCSDGRKNGIEVDVDCAPGYRYCLCSENQACTIMADCRSGLDCYGPDGGSSGGRPLGATGSCHAATPHTLTVIGAASDAPIAVQVSLDGQKPYLITDLGAAGGAALTRSVSAYQQVVMTFAPGFQSRSYCTFDNADSQGRWVWDRTSAPSNVNNTLRCKRAYAKVSFRTNGSACPAEVDYRSDAGFVVTEYRVKSPSITIASLHPGISVENYNTTIVNRSFDVQTGGVSITGLYDGGTAYSLTMGAPSIGAGYFPTYSEQRARDFVATLPPPKKWRYACQIDSPTTGVFGNDVVANVSCTCTVEPDGGFPAIDGGSDAGATDAGKTDAGSDAGASDAGGNDAGNTDAGPKDAGFDAGFDAGVDAGPQDAGSGPLCTTDSDCATGADCYCGDTSGNCAGNSGHCGAGKFSSSTPTTDGVAASGTFTVPTGCSQVRVDAWGAAGGTGQQSFMGFPIPQLGGAGGYVTGILNVTPGQKFTAWVGNAGDVSSLGSAVDGLGSYLGTVTNGGKGDGTAGNDTGGGGGGLTSLLHATAGGSQLNALVVPGGGGAGSSQPGKPAGDTGSGDLSTRPGGDAAGGSTAGGGGAGEKGGSAGMSAMPGLGGSFGPLPSGFTSTPGDLQGNPGGNGTEDYINLCAGNAGKGVTAGSAGNGCVVVRCLP
ncbi:MAG: hypothetical protein K1X89_05560 [Myxococcaceae bacterium]|nr:hypothetical protein [Myxococcaceae bacterium]